MKALDKNGKTSYDGFEQMIKLCAYEQKRRLELNYGIRKID